MIHAYQLFGRDAYSPSEKKILRAAQKTARDMWRNRHDAEYKNKWDVSIDKLTVIMVEKAVVEGILKQYDMGGHYAD